MNPLRVVEEAPCKICGSQTTPIGTKTGRYRPQAFSLRRCRNCGFSFVANPWTDYTAIYSDAYYEGKAADPMVDYKFELEFPDKTIRVYEWRGILAAVQSLIPLRPSTTWLDYGCGNAGLVRYCRSHGVSGMYGFEPGAIRDAAARVAPLLDERQLEARQGTFDIVTAVEVFEHLDDPLSTLRSIRSLLKPGGLLFLTTGNAAPHRANLLEWRYVVPEIHISFFEPETLRLALLKTGFRPDFRGYMPGFTDIIRFKVMKNLHFRSRSIWHGLVPWSLVAWLADARHRVSGHPIGWAE